jgi:hypothetical protein
MTDEAISRLPEFSIEGYRCCNDDWYLAKSLDQVTGKWKLVTGLTRIGEARMIDGKRRERKKRDDDVQT